MRIGICQINPVVGDFDGNRERIEAAAAEVRGEGAQLAVFSELAICGYPSDDLLLREGFLRANDRSLQELAAHLPPDLPTLVGCLERNEGDGRPLYNAVALLEDGLCRIVARKSLLPTYDIFDEARFFEPWREPKSNVISIAGKRVGITICEDAWNDEEFFSDRRYHLDPVEEVVSAGAEILVNLSASPWARRCTDGRGKHEFRAEMLGAISARHQRPLVLVNQYGGNVGVQFDGGSNGYGPDGRCAIEPVYFERGCAVVDTEAEWACTPAPVDLREMQCQALEQGIRDYCRKFGFERVVLGLSGGIDSALTAALAANALGGDNVTGIAMPSRYSSDHSVADAEALARNFGLRYHKVPIDGLQDAWSTALHELFAGTEPGVAEENLQARSRGVILMAHSNKFGAMLLTTGNKSECAVGYCTLYGDMCGGIAPIADLWKTEVYELARWINRDGERIPAGSITKPPSAELRPDQLDTDSLPPYDELDPILRHLVELDLPVGEVAEQLGAERELVAELFRKVQRSEYKRVQYPPTVRVSDRCWDGRRVPASHRFVAEKG